MWIACRDDPPSRSTTRHLDTVFGVLTLEDMHRLFAPLRQYRRAALAVSGGGDSMALMLLARAWAGQAPEAPELLALTVDHGLRAGSRQEAEWVAARACDLNVTHHVLTWDGAPPGASQAEARDARYTLMADFARVRGIDVLVTAHTADDVAETFLMRLTRGSGVDGLAAMASHAWWEGAPVLRPLLGVSRSQLRDTLNAHGVSWLEDPSNSENRFERVRIRRALETLGELGITRPRIVESAERLRRARSAIEYAASAFIRAEVEISAAGYIRLDAQALRAVPEEVAIHVLGQLLRAVGGRCRPPRLRKLEALAADLRQCAGSATTLGGCVISREAEGDKLVVCREPGRLGGPSLSLFAGEVGIWDRRFRITCGDVRQSVEVRALGGANLPMLPEPVRKQHPPAALAALPALYADDELLGVPVSGLALSRQHPDAAACTAEAIWTRDTLV